MRLTSLTLLLLAGTCLACAVPVLDASGLAEGIANTMILILEHSFAEREQLCREQHDKWGDDCIRIARFEPWIGMTEDQLLHSWGAPKATTPMADPTAVLERWTYDKLTLWSTPEEPFEIDIAGSYFVIEEREGVRFVRAMELKWPPVPSQNSVHVDSTGFPDTVNFVCSVQARSSQIRVLG